MSENSTAIDLSYVDGLDIQNVVIENFQTGLKLQHARNVRLTDIEVLNDRDGFDKLLEAVRALDDARARSALNKIKQNPQSVSAWKVLVRKVGKPALNMAREILSETVAATIVAYASKHGV